MTDREVMQQALEALSHHRDQGRPCIEQTAYDALRARLAEPEPEIERLRAECDALRAALKFIADHDLRGTDLTVAGHIAHALIGKARAALKELEK